ncbi:TetR/AcrR family transcriptional regulator [Streptomyces sp. A1136]|uniref:TetR/AcrR family transcriptional regulator n=1 Tax=Streptomyces sp. A1136 TaxID=2563102 RepID=UPI00109E8F14|nr:TetR/AcrR family transcriptional regulator [Streptomyces sp. A1136]THA56342.1 TetR/AcrR family transcriptional regulator [Streptomyces sp. A1136]
MARMSAEERRESVIRAAMQEFARGGYYGTSTEVIAKRVGVSQPYLFRLFPNKQAIFVAAVARCTEDIRVVFEEAAAGCTSEEALHSMGDAYLRLIAEHPDKLQMQLQASLTVAAAEAAGEAEFGEMVRAGWMRLWDTVHLALGADIDQTTDFMAHGMLINTLTALGFPPDHRVWAGCYLNGKKSAAASPAGGEGEGPGGVGNPGEVDA